MGRAQGGSPGFLTASATAGAWHHVVATWGVNVDRKAGAYNNRKNSNWSPSRADGDDVNPVDFGWLAFE